MTKDRITFTTPGTALKELVASGTDNDMASKVVAVASIIKGFTKNVMIDVASPNGVLRGEAWFYMKNTNENERFNNRMAYKVLVDLIDPKIKVGSFLWADNETGTHIDGVHCDVIDINFFGTGDNEKPDMTYAREEAEMRLQESVERLKQGDKPEVNENTQVNPMRTMNLWSTDDDDERSIESWADEPYSFGEDDYDDDDYDDDE